MISVVPQVYRLLAEPFILLTYHYFYCTAGLPPHRRRVAGRDYLPAPDLQAADCQHRAQRLAREALLQGRAGVGFRVWVRGLGEALLQGRAGGAPALLVVEYSFLIV